MGYMGLQGPQRALHEPSAVFQGVSKGMPGDLRSVSRVNWGFQGQSRESQDRLRGYQEISGAFQEGTKKFQWVPRSHVRFKVVSWGSRDTERSLGWSRGSHGRLNGISESLWDF